MEHIFIYIYKRVFLEVYGCVAMLDVHIGYPVPAPTGQGPDLI